ncbi:hypothetical protein HPB49_010648 [Dermacentor silvarum]|uniref:Uncharacterized protein n=1 Tax=Dermacentor silvarum TaxID=543639 RepID=A0ACB8C317_DERSI|nr:hypothetical protein HPB49_010648 [Dermacentor silvarum]
MPQMRWTTNHGRPEMPLKLYKDLCDRQLRIYYVAAALEPYRSATCIAGEGVFQEDGQAHRHQVLSLRQPGRSLLLSRPGDVIPHRAQLGDVPPLLLVRVDGARHVVSRRADVHVIPPRHLYRRTVPRDFSTVLEKLFSDISVRQQ